MKLVLAITGASGAIYPRLFLEFLKKTPDIKVFVVASENAHKVFLTETGQKLSELIPDINKTNDFDVPYVSGSAKLDAMVVLPCSMGMMGRIANGISDDAISRAADVFLKEQRKLILVPRETPYNLIHLENMTRAARAGATILPATPHFYADAKNPNQIASTVIARILDHLGIEHDLVKRWHD
jgi:4-hydroxy-3-polyprenylbenzoate decarboxylase